MSAEDRIERARLACERAIFVGDVGVLATAERELNAVEADLAVARGRVMQARSHEQQNENPDELALFQRATELYQMLGDVRGEGESLFGLAPTTRCPGATTTPRFLFLNGRMSLRCRSATNSRCRTHFGIWASRSTRRRRAAGRCA